MIYNYNEIADQLIEDGGHGKAEYYDEDTDLYIQAMLYYKWESTGDGYLTEKEYYLSDFDFWLVKAPQDLNESLLYETIENKLAA